MILSRLRLTHVAATIACAAAVFVTTTASAVKPSERFTIVDLAIAANGPGGALEGQLDTLIDFVANDEVVLNTLTGNGQFTVFAPTDDAFTALVDALTANCIAPTPELVRTVLLYHVARGNRDSSIVLESDRIRTLSGAFFHQMGGIITDNAGQTAAIIGIDNFADNGVVHVIDTVILPFPVESACE